MLHIRLEGFQVAFSRLQCSVCLECAPSLWTLHLDPFASEPIRHLVIHFGHKFFSFSLSVRPHELHQDLNVRPHLRDSHLEFPHSLGIIFMPSAEFILDLIK